ncbi:hypothetical protein D4764_01G0015950 [Takifugu flavidus]|uniref:DDE-1 domain-containing protein n=1 Tax=Takifugu flavidus TaxID=433684 RepID=A0A5C6PTM5_9TELE|nr:hypothetical protein D4764_01G0015950 [Takifugu flavidus]
MAPCKRHAYDAEFKLTAISHAVEHGNRVAEREFNVNETMVRKWRKQQDDLRQANGQKLPPMVIFKRKTVPKENFPVGVSIKANSKGWMDEEKMRNIIRQHGINFHCYADDTQLYLSLKPEETEKLVKLQTCLKDIKSWMSSNFLLLNSGKTEVMVFGPEPLRDRLDHMITLDGISLTSSLSVLRGLVPSYLEELVIPYQPNRPLRFQNAGLLVVPRVSRSRMGGRAFSYQAPLLWNQLPVQAKAAGVRKHDHLCIAAFGAA